MSKLVTAYLTSFCVEYSADLTYFCAEFSVDLLSFSIFVGLLLYIFLLSILLPNFSCTQAIFDFFWKNRKKLCLSTSFHRPTTRSHVPTNPPPPPPKKVPPIQNKKIKIVYCKFNAKLCKIYAKLNAKNCVKSRLNSSVHLT